MPQQDTENRPFSPLHQTTTFVNPLIVGPPPLHWLGIVGGASAIVWLFHYSLFLFSFFPKLFLPLLLNFVLFYSYILSARAYLSWRMAWAYWAYPTFASSWACGSAYCHFMRGWPIGPYFFLFLYLGFFSPQYLLLLTNLLLHSFLYLLLGFSAISPFYKKCASTHCKKVLQIMLKLIVKKKKEKKKKALWRISLKPKVKHLT